MDRERPQTQLRFLDGLAAHLLETVLLPWGSTPDPELSARLRTLLAGDAAPFVAWIQATIPAESPAFDRMAVAADLEALVG